MNRLVLVVCLLYVFTASPLLLSCEREGPAERAGKEVDRSFQDLKDAATRATRR